MVGATYNDCALLEDVAEFSRAVVALKVFKIHFAVEGEI
jgi:hypothetical protein